MGRLDSSKDTMTAITAAMRAGLDNVYAKFGANGIVDIGLQSALDIGVKESNYIQVPQLCFNEITPRGVGGRALDNIANGPSGTRLQ